MTFAIWKPPTPAYESWVSISDADRFFKPKCWDLPKIVEAIDAGTLKIELSTTAQHDFLVDVKFNRSNIVAFLNSCFFSKFKTSCIVVMFTSINMQSFHLAQYQQRSIYMNLT